MINTSYYEADLPAFFDTNENEILGALTAKHNFALVNQQRYAWQEQIKILKSVLIGREAGKIFFEFRIPRMGKRADVVLLIESVIFVVEFKVGSETFDGAALDQVHDYALDLKNFHSGSHCATIVPLLVATRSESQPPISYRWATDSVASPIRAAPSDIAGIIASTLALNQAHQIDPLTWASTGYHPTPTIVEAAQALYRNHDVEEITRSGADAQNLGSTTNRISEIIEGAKANRRKAICFVTGVPGAGKTLAGLNIATTRVIGHADEHAVFLSGNGPLVDVLREALSRLLKYWFRVENQAKSRVTDPLPASEKSLVARSTRSRNSRLRSSAGISAAC